MSPFVESSMEVAERLLDNALANLEHHANGGPASLAGDAYADLRRLRGVLMAVMQLQALEAEVADACAKRPSLRIVK